MDKTLSDLALIKEEIKWKLNIGPSDLQPRNTFTSAVLTNIYFGKLQHINYVGYKMLLKCVKTRKDMGKEPDKSTTIYAQLAKHGKW